MEFFYIFTSFPHHVSILILVIYHFEVFSPLYMSVSNKFMWVTKRFHLCFCILHEDIKGLIEAYSEIDIIVIIIIISIINNQLLYQNIV